MCGIFGIIDRQNVNITDLEELALLSERRGRDSSGLLMYANDAYNVLKADWPVKKLFGHNRIRPTRLAMGHSRLITNGNADNQPVVRNGIAVLHNGIVLNHEELWEGLPIQRGLEIDSEIIAALAGVYLESGGDVSELPDHILSQCRGSVSAALVLAELGKLLLLTNTGSLFHGIKGEAICFASEHHTLEKVGCVNITQVPRGGQIYEVPVGEFTIENIEQKRQPLVHLLDYSTGDKSLRFKLHDLRRCTKCILPETMPFIRFNSEGVCNYCDNYIPQTTESHNSTLLELVEPYRRSHGAECIVPFSGGRDSCYALHLIVNELKLKPITYTYDWGMVTDLGRRNISLMCGELGVENIVIADDIPRKRRNIVKNLKAWLRHPDLGMINILMAGDKHFYKHVETISRETGIALKLWGINPLEVTHFKSGFLGVPPQFMSKNVYRTGLSDQLDYQMRRIGRMFRSPGYFNSSLIDTWRGEYYRSIMPKTDYFHVFDFWPWSEDVVDHTLQIYGWETAVDTSTTWRIGDGTAAFYNYVYYQMAGFTEHDTFRSNQIREGHITREEAIHLVNDENRPRFQNIKWYLDSIGMDFQSTIDAINRAKPVHEALT